MTARSSDPAMPRVIKLTRELLLKERDALHEAVAGYVATPVPGSPYSVEKDAWKFAPKHTQYASRRSLWVYGLNYTRLIFVNIID